MFGYRARHTPDAVDLDAGPTLEDIISPTPVLSAVEPATAKPSGTAGRHMSIVAVGNLVPPLAAIIAAPILARSLGVDGRGEVAAATAPLLLAMFLSTIGLPESLTYHAARDPHRAHVYFRRAGLLLVLPAVVSLAILLALTPILSDHDAELARLMIVSSAALPVVMGVNVLRALASARNQWSRVAAEQVVSAAIRITAIVVIVVFGSLTVLEATIITASAPYIGGLAYISRPNRHHRAHPSPVEFVRSTPFLGYGSRIWIGSISGILLLRLDQTLMTPLSSAAQLGLYAVAVNVSEVALVINNAVRDVTFVSSAQARDLKAVTRSARLSGAASLTFAAVIAICVPVGLPLAFGEAFRDAVPTTLLLLFAVAIGTPGSVAGAELSGSGHPGKRSTSLVIAAIVNVVALIPLVSLYGAFGAALATLLGNLVSSNGNILFLRRMHGVSPWAFYGLRRGDLAGFARARRRRKADDAAVGDSDSLTTADPIETR